MGFVEAMKKI